jgi:aspartyl/asparaginyl beta-hydroxylase (cupin superfamily)/Flp pilus assembly protein TadD
MSTSVAELITAAGQAAHAGLWAEAERLWCEVRRLEPQHPRALFSLGFHALQRGDAKEALELLTAARLIVPDDPMLLLTLAAAREECNDPEGEFEAIQAALTIDAYYLPALLAKARWLERSGNQPLAARAYTNALKVAPPRPRWPADLRARLEHASNFVDTYSTDYLAYLTVRLQGLQSELTPHLGQRWREAISIMAGRSKAYHAECNTLCVPRLPAIPFFDRAEFPWLASLEAKTDVIREELLGALSPGMERFRPYIARKPGEPLNQWQELNQSLRWGALKLWDGGLPVPENVERCPQTAKALAELPLVEIDGLCPNAMFSALQPRTRIPPHNGETNARLVAHLPLIVPDGCMFRVGFEEREWKVGEVMIFDDTLEHEARNDSDELRVVLIFDMWNPLLSDAEREIMRTLSVAAREYSP